jgi:hypothetical protein
MRNKKMTLAALLLGVVLCASGVPVGKIVRLSSLKFPAAGVLQKPGDTVYPVVLISVNLTGEWDYSKMSLEEVSAIHNEAMEYVVQKVAESGVCPSDNEEFRSHLAGYLQSFFAERGLKVEYGFNSISAAPQLDQPPFCRDEWKLSSLAQKLSCGIAASMDKYATGAVDREEFNKEIDDIIHGALELEDPYESKQVQLTAAIGRSSAFYWQDNLIRMRKVLNKACKKDQENVSMRARVPWGSVATSDASGAFNWGRVGFAAAGGPAGAVACGLAGAAGTSLLRLVCFGIFGS